MDHSYSSKYEPWRPRTEERSIIVDKGEDRRRHADRVHARRDRDRAVRVVDVRVAAGIMVNGESPKCETFVLVGRAKIPK